MSDKSPADEHASLHAAPPWTMLSPPRAETNINGRNYLYFNGTGYLGLQGEPAVIAAAHEALDLYGVHTATSRAGFGTCPPVREVEERAARLLGAESALYLVSGYPGNFAIAAAIADRVDVTLIDELSHDCLKESLGQIHNLRMPPLVFRHRDANHVAELMRQHVKPGERPLLLCDGVFSMSGRLSPLRDYIQALSQHEGAMLYVDDAHGLGAIGANGRGSLEVAGVPAGDVNRDFGEPVSSAVRVFCSATLSKAIGGHGGVIAGSRAFLDRVRSASGWYRGASAPAAPVAGATAKALEIVAANPGLRERLQANVAAVHAALAAIGLPVEPGPAPIVGVTLESAERMQAVHRHLLEAGVAIGFSRQYAGVGPLGMLRIAVFATHTPAMIARLAAALREALAATAALA